MNDLAFSISVLLSVALSNSRYTSDSGTFSSAYNSLFMLFNQSAFLCSFSSLILLQNCFISGCWFVLMHFSHVVVGKISFLYFAMSPFVSIA